MTTRTVSKILTFKHPFQIGVSEEMQPAGSYKVDTDEELIEGLSFVSYRRVLMVIHLHSKSKIKSLTRALTITAKELEAALCQDNEKNKNILEDMQIKYPFKG